MASTAARRRQALFSAQLTLRGGSASAGAGARQEAIRDLELEQILAEPILRGLEQPRVRVDAVGLIVLGGRPPASPDDTNEDI